MSMSATLHNVVECTHRPLEGFEHHVLKLTSGNGDDVAIFVKPHIAAAMAAAFNAAMAEQAEQAEIEGAPA